MVHKIECGHNCSNCRYVLADIGIIQYPFPCNACLDLSNSDCYWESTDIVHNEQDNINFEHTQQFHHKLYTVQILN